MQYTFYEYEAATYQDLGISSTHPLVEDLEILNEKHRVDLLRIRRYDIQATQYVGMVQTRHGSLTILPKVDRAVDLERVATHNLMTMLSYAYDLPLMASSEAGLSTSQGTWFEMLTGLFVRRLYEQLRQGIERMYVTLEERSPALKGRWLLEQQLVRQPHVRHAFDIRYDDFIADTPLNRVFRYVVEVLTYLSRSSENQRLLIELRALLDAATLLPRITTADLNRVIFTRLNERFYSAFQIARMLIESMTQVLQAGTAPLTAFIFDMNVLFESFVAAFLAKHWRDIAVNVHRDFHIVAQMKGAKSAYLAQREDGIPVFQLRPDLLLRDTRERNLLVIDTKYKRLDPDKRKLDIAEADVYQMLAYAVRLECPRVLLLYPSHQGQVIQSRLSVVQSDVQIDVQTINLHQSLLDPRVLISDFQRIFAPYLY